MTRQEAIDILKRKMNGSIDTSYEWAEAIRMAIQALKHPEPCKDTISRQAAIDAIVNRTVTVDTNAQWLSGHARCELEIIDIINALPAQPERKTGKWIERNPQNSDKCRLIECDQCGFSHIVGFNVPYEHWIENRNFCERCGAKMEGNG